MPIRIEQQQQNSVVTPLRPPIVILSDVPSLLTATYNSSDFVTLETDLAEAEALVVELPLEVDFTRSQPVALVRRV